MHLQKEVDAMPQIENGTVSGNVDLISSNPWSTEGNITYTIPDNVKEITSVKVIINTYSGSGSPNYGLYSNSTLNTTNGFNILGYETLTFTESTSGSDIVYSINNHTTKQYSDCQMIYDITNNVKNLTSGETINIHVINSQIANKSFDGRIKQISLFFAYNDGDEDKISYWLNVGQS